MEEHGVREENGDVDSEQVEVFPQLTRARDGGAALERREDRPRIEVRREARDVEIALRNVLEGFERLAPGQLAVRCERLGTLVHVDVEVDDEDLVERAQAAVLGEDVRYFGRQRTPFRAGPQAQPAAVTR